MQMNSHLQFPEHEHLNCPRCDSDNTKFCYYNNYNLSQPRHYCKNCRRYWTKGGTLRKIPIGGGTRKTTKRSSTSNKRHAHDDSSTTPPLPVQFKPEESSPVFDLNNDNKNQSKLSFNSLLRSNYRSFVTPNLMDGSGLDKTAGTGVFTYLGTTTTNNTNHNNESGESSGTGWPNLSIFTSGSSFS